MTKRIINTDTNLSDDYLKDITINCLIFGYGKNALKVLLFKPAVGFATGNWCLPGGFVKKAETLEEAAMRLLAKIAGVTDVYLEQLKTYSQINRHPEKRVISTAFIALVKTEDYPLSINNKEVIEVKWTNINQVPNLMYDHPQMLQDALQKLREKMRRKPIIFNLLPKKFTLLQLQETYEALLGIQVNKPNFRRKILKLEVLTPLKEKQKDVSHRAARFYYFNQKKYSLLSKSGNQFFI